MIFGKSTHSIKELNLAIEENADYVSIGPAFPSPTKPDIDVTGLQYAQNALEVLSNHTIAHVAIGGITIENVQQLLEIGVRAIAVGSVVMNSENPEMMCIELKKVITRYN